MSPTEFTADLRPVGLGDWLEQEPFGVSAGMVAVPAIRQACEGLARRFLTERELAAYHAFSVPKRRAEWLAARIVAKGLVCGRLPVLSPLDFTIERQTAPPREGRPAIALAPGAGPAPDLSLSHSHRWAAGAVASTGRVGIDLERVDAVGPAAEEMALDEQELGAIAASCPAASAAECRALAWVVKESMLKAVGVGFQAGFHALTLERYAHGQLTCVTTLPELGRAAPVQLRYALFDGHAFCLTWIAA